MSKLSEPKWLLIIELYKLTFFVHISRKSIRCQTALRKGTLRDRSGSGAWLFRTFLSEIRPIRNPKACRRLIQLCFSKFSWRNGQQSQNAGGDCKGLQSMSKSRKPISKDLQDIIYRLINFADIQISNQALGLLKEVFVPGHPKHPQRERFYSALCRCGRAYCGGDPEVGGPILVVTAQKKNGIFEYLERRLWRTSGQTEEARHFGRSLQYRQVFGEAIDLGTESFEESEHKAGKKRQ